jgi:hypothetical protein
MNDSMTVVATTTFVPVDPEGRALTFNVLKENTPIPAAFAEALLSN